MCSTPPLAVRASADQHVQIRLVAIAHVIDEGDFRAKKVGVAVLAVEEDLQLLARRRGARVLGRGARRRHRVNEANEQDQCGTERVHGVMVSPGIAGRAGAERRRHLRLARLARFKRLTGSRAFWDNSQLSRPYYFTA